MRLVSYKSDRGNRVAAVVNNSYVDLNDADPSLPSSIKQLLAQGKAGFEQAQRAVSRSTAGVDPASVVLLPTVPDPQKVICVGLNYADHAAESGAEVGEEPVIFNKFPSALRAHGETIQLPAESQKVDYEAELVVVIGTGGRYIPQESALEHIAGYCVGHDVSARAGQLHKPGGQWLLGKTFDTFAPLGPELVTRDEVPSPGELGISLRLNGQTMQDSNTRQLIFGIEYLVAYISKICTLLPGDLIYTGTPPGVGAARKPPVFLKAGDTVEVEIESLGILRNAVVGPEA